METVAPNADQACVVGVAVLAVFFAFVVLIGTGLSTLIFCMIFHKASYSWALGLLMLVPVANVIVPFILAFGNWPILRELRELRQQQGGPPG